MSTAMRKLLVSDRGIPLVYQCEQNRLDARVLTVESYIKWYSIFSVGPEGDVRKLAEKDWEGYTESRWDDHIPHPAYCAWLEDRHPEYVWDIPSLELICGRWIAESCTRDVAITRAQIVWEIMR